MPQGFDAWLARCVAGDPTQRFADGAAAGEALLPVLRPGAPAVPKTALLTAVPLAPVAATVARTEALPAVSLMSSGTEALPRAVIEQAIAPPPASPRVLGAAPAAERAARGKTPARSPRRWPWVLLGVGLLAGGAELALTLSHRADPAGPAVTGMDAGAVVPIPVVGPRADVTLAPLPAWSRPGADVVQPARVGRRSRDEDAAAESPWYYDVPTVWDHGATTHLDAGHLRLPARRRRCRAPPPSSKTPVPRIPPRPRPPRPSNTPARTRPPAPRARRRRRSHAPPRSPRRARRVSFAG